MSLSERTDRSSSSLLALLGDSDIERWPADLLPACYDTASTRTCSSSTSNSGDAIPVTVRGQSGATLEEVLPLMASVLAEAEARTSLQSFTVVFCAGENDISQSIRLDEILIYFRKLLDMMFPPPQPLQHTSESTAKSFKRHLIVLGPKFEPWLQYDASCRKQYFKLSNAMERACKKKKQQFESSADQGENATCTITFIDCLTMFCGDSAKLPGAVLAGKAIPEKKYFDYDLLHLSRDGYEIWRQIIEQCLDQKG